MLHHYLLATDRSDRVPFASADKIASILRRSSPCSHHEAFTIRSRSFVRGRSGSTGCAFDDRARGHDLCPVGIELKTFLVTRI